MHQITQLQVRISKFSKTFPPQNKVLVSIIVDDTYLCFHIFFDKKHHFKSSIQNFPKLTPPKISKFSWGWAYPSVEPLCFASSAQGHINLNRLCPCPAEILGSAFFFSEFVFMKLALGFSNL